MGLPDVPAAWDRCTHSRHLLPHSKAASQLPKGDGPCGVPDEQEVCRGGGVGKAGRPVHAGLNGQLMLARV